MRMPREGRRKEEKENKLPRERERERETCKFLDL